MSKYDFNSLKATALAAISENKLIFFSEVSAYTPCDLSTLNRLKVNEDEEVIALLTSNKTNIKAHLRKKWYQSENPTLQLALYRLCGTDEERRLLNTQNGIDVPENAESITIKFVPSANNSDK